MNRRGFTLIELIVVIALIAMITGVFLASFGVFTAGDPLRIATFEIRGLVEKGRSLALARQSRFEMLIDYERNEIHSWERRPITFFGFGGELGADEYLISGNLKAKPPNYYENLHTGAALAVWAGARSFTIAEDASFTAKSEHEGIAFGFDFSPQMDGGMAVRIIGQRDWHVQVDRTVGRVTYLSALIHGIPYTSKVPVGYGEWAQIEIVISNRSPRFYVNGVAADLAFGARAKRESVAAAMENLRSGKALVGAGSIIIGGGTTIAPFLMDNLRIDKLAPLEVTELGRDYGVT
ncbi:MAG: prepilin-type N-terminal cleavage/methylation domain-containing protein, partial [Planctomycetes bacterium]|nr:prepilin-type N-terminal cleavage/methylation domain-containing protein [Planctomycetota bacterium]